jgi:hypothetical protein
VIEDFDDRPVEPAGESSARDLLGDPLRELRDPRGRKKLKVSKELRERVAILSAGGMDREDIADAIGCSERTLRTYFLPELNEGKSAKRAEAVAKLFELGMSGSVPALKAFLALGVKTDTMPRMPREPKLGKKDQLLKDAETAHHSSGWGELVH